MSHKEYHIQTDNNSSQRLHDKFRRFAEIVSKESEPQINVAPELFPNILKQFSELVARAPITERFRKQIVYCYKDTFYHNTTNAPVTDDESLVNNHSGNPLMYIDIKTLLNLDQSPNGGIFNPEHAKEIEERAYRIETRELLDLCRLLKVDEKDKHANLSFKNVTNGQAIHLREWRQQFIDRYHDEP